MTAAAAHLDRSLKVAAGVIPMPDRKLSVTTIGEIKRKLEGAMIDVQIAGLHSKGNSQARNTILPVYRELRSALDVFEAAYRRGVL